MMSSKYVIELSKADSKLSVTSSKGNQPKYTKDNKWIKVDYLGYEGLAEVLCSRLAKSLRFPYDVVTYEPCIICDYYKGDRTGCFSYNFIGSAIEFKLPKLLNNIFGFSIDSIIDLSTQEKINTVINLLSKLSGLEEFGTYLTAVLEFDRLVLNEDRHFNNILILYDEQKDLYFPSPLFDNGAALLSDYKGDYPLEDRLYDCKRRIKAKPFSKDFNKQVFASQTLYGEILKPDKSIRLNVDDLYSYYKPEMITRCINIINTQLAKYYPDCELIVSNEEADKESSFFL